MMRRAAITFLLGFASIIASAQGFDGIFDEQTATDAGQAPITAQGEIGAELEYFVDDAWQSEVAGRALAAVDLIAEGESAKAVLSLNLDTSEAASGELVGNLVNEAYVTSYFGAGHVTAGRMKVEWGSGDGLHAIDPLNATDQSVGPTTDYLASRRSETMVDLNLYLGGSTVAEIVYKPFFHPTSVAVTGRWAVVDPATIPGYATIEPVDVRTLEYSQGAARLSGSLGAVDLGGVYYYGFMPEAGYSYTSTFTGTDPLDPADYTISADIVYTRAQLFGFDAAAAAGPFTIRGEAGYWLSEDSDGSVASLYNSRLVYLGGADVTIPGTSVFTSVQILGSYTMAASDLSSDDVDLLRLSDGLSTSTMIVGAVEVPFARDTMRVRVAGTYAVEQRGYLVLPEYSLTIADGAALRIRGTIIGGESPDSGMSPYYAWRDNDNVSIGLSYQF